MGERSRNPRGPITLFCDSRRFRSVVFIVVLLPVLYVAGYAPIMWWLLKNLGYPTWMDTAAEYVYAPLWPMLNVTPQWARDAFDAYEDWWGRPEVVPYQIPKLIGEFREVENSDCKRVRRGVSER